MSSPHFLDDDQSLPEEQIQLYEECGWKLTAENGLVHVFSAPEGSDAPEFYSDPRQQAATFRALKRSYWVGWIVAFMILGFHAAMLFGLSSVSSFQTLQRFAADFVVGWVEETATVLFYAAFVLLAVYEMLYGTIRTMLLCRRLKRGKPLDHSPRRHIVYQIITAALAICLVFSGIGALIQWRGECKILLPEVSDGPYFLLSEAGFDGERSVTYGNDSTLFSMQSLNARVWKTYECVENGDDTVWVYQDIYQLHSPQAAKRFVQKLMCNATFARSPDDFKPVEINGLDEAWLCGDLEALAVKGDMVCRMDYSSRSVQSDLSAMLKTLAAHWNAE